MAMPTLRQLRYFEALHRHRSFGRAADAAAVSQPALSVQIKALEGIAGGALFDRGGGAVRPTPFGEAYAERVREVLLAVDTLGQLRPDEDGDIPRRLRLGLIPTIAPYLVGAVGSFLRTERPEVDLTVRETMTDRLLEEVLDARLDAAIVALPVSEPKIVEAPLFDEAFVLVRPRREAGAPVPTPAGLDRMRLLLLEEGHCFRDQALAICRTPPASRARTLDGTSLATLVRMVGAEMGVTLIPEMAVPTETRSTAVVWDRFDPPEPKRTVGLIWRRANPMARGIESLHALLARGLSHPPD